MIFSTSDLSLAKNQNFKWYMLLLHLLAAQNNSRFAEIVLHASTEFIREGYAVMYATPSPIL